MRAITMAFGLMLSLGAQAGQMIAHDAVLVGDGSTRLVNCTNSKGHLVLYSPVNSAETYVVRSDIRDARISDVMAQILPNGWTVRYTSPALEDDLVNLQASTYWLDALKVVTHDYNLVTVVDGEKRQVVLGRL